MVFTGLDRFLEDTLSVQYVEGGLSTVTCPYTTGWRAMPYAMVAQWQGGDIRYARAGEPALTVQQGSVVLAPADLTHCVTTLAVGTVHCRWAHIHMTLCGGLDVLRVIPAPPVITGPASARLGELCLALSKVREDLHLPALTRMVRTRSLEYQLLETLLTLVDWSSPIMEHIQSISHILPVLVFIQEHFTDDIRRDELAGILGLSSAQFHVVFKRAMGITPLEYVIRLRIRHAQVLLLQTTDQVATVAENAGFHDPFHFSRLFRTRCGMSPTQYRRDTRRLPIDGNRPYALLPASHSAM